MLQSAQMGPQRSIYKKVFTFLFHFSLTVSVFFSFPSLWISRYIVQKLSLVFLLTRRKVQPFGILLLWREKQCFLLMKIRIASKFHICQFCSDMIKQISNPSAKLIFPFQIDHSNPKKQIVVVLYIWINFMYYKDIIFFMSKV